MENRVLLIEDEVSLRKSLRKLLELNNYVVTEADRFAIAEELLRANIYHIFLLDLRLPDQNGILLLDKYRSQMENKTIIITAHATVPGAVEAIKKGAFYYIEKPLDEKLLFLQMEKILETNRLKEKNMALKQELLADLSPDRIIYKSPAMMHVISLAKKLAQTDLTVLLQGETGVGKEVIASFLHKHSRRRHRTFLPINCSSIHEQLFESELFGFKKGAFTGAVDNYKGRFIQADKGTLFLDEIAEIPLHLQSKLLRVLDDKIIYQLGNKKPEPVDVRVVAASNKDLFQEVLGNHFRKDLFYRLSEAVITIPPLRERKEDIIPLFMYFSSLYNEIYDHQIKDITPEAQQFMLEYSWEGNVRELKNCVKNIFSINSGSTVSVNDLILTLKTNRNKPEEEFVPLEQYELSYIQKVLKATGHNIKQSAKILGITRSRLYRKIKEIGQTNGESTEAGKASS